MAFVLVGIVVVAGVSWVVHDYLRSRRREPPWLKKMREDIEREREGA